MGVPRGTISFFDYFCVPRDLQFDIFINSYIDVPRETKITIT